MNPITTIATANIVAEPVKIAIKDLYDFVKKKSKDAVLKWRAEDGINDLYLNIEQIRNVKSIWQIDRPVDLSKFYVPLCIRLPEHKRQRLTDLSLFENGMPVLLEGIAGQGKSTVMRYLCSNEMISGSTLPIFIELRRIRSGESLFDHMVRFLDILGIKLTNDLLLDFLAVGKVSLFLDGFDEVDDEIKPCIVDQIEEVCRRQKNCKILVTSRPNQTIKGSAFLTNIKLDNLKGDEYKEVIYKISESRDYADSLIKVVEEHKKDIKGLLCTPLFVTLLVISYKSFQQVPEQLSDFYDSLFRVLLQRHDGSKPGYSRKKESGLNDSKFKEVFDALCYFSKKQRKQVLLQAELVESTASALKALKLDITPDSFLNDVSDVTCLLVHDDEEWRFIHRSIQDFFSASFIKSRPESQAEKIYSLLAKKFDPQWSAELEFLKSIDTYRFQKYFFIPVTKKILGINTHLEHLESPKVSNKLIKNILGGFNLSIQAKIPFPNPQTAVRTINTSVFLDEDSFPPLPGFFESCVEFLLSKKMLMKAEAITSDDGEEKIISIDLNRLLAQPKLKPEITQFVEKLIDEIFTEAKQAEENVKQTDAESMFEEVFD